LANPYLAFAAMLLAGLDGIANKIDPGEAIEENLYEMKNHQVTSISRNLREALYHLDQDREFLQKDNIFDDEMINSYIEQKDIELNSIENMPHPLEFKLYYNG
jgi:glutamine synthetase